MECQQCRKDVETVYGNGAYPNSAYKCAKCIDDETGKIVGGFIAILLWVIFIALCVGQI